MKSLAGGAFHQRKPMQAPIMAAATTVTSMDPARNALSVVSRRSYASGCRNWVKEITTKAANTSAAEPAARPSSPSVMFTALVVA